jgi:regulator of sigma E protease
LDPNPVNPHPKPHDIAEAGPIDPSTGQPDHAAEVSALKTWFRQNVVSLVITAAVVGLVIWKLDPIDTLKVVIGLGLVIFIHELGHFLAAKWCDVHVRTFSIGFGPAVPFCSYKWGETTYMVGIVPLGGYVSMVGENDAGDEEGEEDPRSFRKKTVGQRMLIISAGVVMNVILGMACFVAAYMHGVREQPATAGLVGSGTAAWKAGMRTDDDVLDIDGRKNPVFNDIRPKVMATQKGETVEVVVRHPSGHEEKLFVEPLRDEGALFPQIGISPPERLVLASDRKRSSFKPVVKGSPAEAAKDPGFEQGDRIVGMTDPADPSKVTPLPPDPKSPDRPQPDFREYHRRAVLLADKPVTFHVLRKDQKDGEQPTAITVGPAYRHDLGMRMLMGEIVAVRANSPAARAGIVARSEEPPVRGDKIAAVGVTLPNGKRAWFANGKRPEEAKPDDEQRPLDPVLLPLELTKWAAGFPEDERKKGLKVDLIVLREAGHTTKRVSVALDYDDSYRFDREPVSLPNSPLPVSGLGLAYWVEAVVSHVEPNGPAAAAGVQVNDLVEAIRFRVPGDEGRSFDDDKTDIKPHQWASVEAGFQRRTGGEFDLRVKRGDESVVVTVKARPDPNWPADDRGLLFQMDYRTQRATDVGHAIMLGAYTTVRFIKTVYMNLYSMIFGRVSAKTMSGPLTIANSAYRIAGEDFWQFLLFLGMISVNLAVVNFLPIPVLDGGHMVFLILEKVLGRPVPDRLFTWAMGIGLAMILLLMIYVISLDVRRLFFGLF